MFISRKNLVEVFFTKLSLNIKSEASRTYLSYVWWLLEPALMVAVFYLVFAVFLARRTPDFIVFLVCGKIPFLWFSKSVSNASNSIVAGRGLINQTSIPMPFFPLLVVFQDAFKNLFVFILVIVFLISFGVNYSWVWLSIVFVMLTNFILICSIALFVSAITPYLPDFRYLLASMMIALMLGSGIFYSYKDVILEEHQQLFLMNPVANLIKNYRQVLMDNTLPDWNALFYISLSSVALIIVMALYYRKTNADYARLITQ